MTNDDDAHGAKAAAEASEAGQPAMMIHDDAHSGGECEPSP